MSDDDGRIIELFPGGDDGGEAMGKWRHRLLPYLDERVLLEPARQAPQPEPPWPAEDNPMLGYLIDRAGEIAAAEGEAAAYVWLGVHAWFEGGLDERFRTIRHMTGHR